MVLRVESVPLRKVLGTSVAVPRIDQPIPHRVVDILLMQCLTSSMNLAALNRKLKEAGYVESVDFSLPLRKVQGTSVAVPHLDQPIPNRIVAIPLIQCLRSSTNVAALHRKLKEEISLRKP